MKYFCLILFIITLIFLFLNNYNKNIEPFDNKKPYRCPNILIQKGKDIFLYNSNLAKVPGVNPIRFNTLEDYVEFTQWQHSQGIRCPVLFLQHSYDAQGNPVYINRIDPIHPKGGLPPTMPMDKTLPEQTLLLDSTRNNPPYNKNQYPGFDPLNQYQGLDTPLDKMATENSDNISPNPMARNWGGHEYTMGLLNSGFYRNNAVYLPTS